MLQKDKIKAIVGATLIGLILLVFYFFGKEVAKYAAILGFAVWLLTMYILNKK